MKIQFSLKNRNFRARSCSPMGNDRIARKGECVGSSLVGRRLKRGIDPVNDCLKKRGVNAGQVRRVVYDRNEWRGFVWRNTWGIAWE